MNNYLFYLGVLLFAASSTLSAQKREIKPCVCANGKKADYYIYPKAIPPYEPSELIEEVLFDRYRYHSGEGDMWPLTWGKDDNIYLGAGDNKGCTVNVWKLRTFKRFNLGDLTQVGQWSMDMICPSPTPDDSLLMADKRLEGVKPSGLLDVDGTLYMSFEAQNYGDNPLFRRQHNLFGWIAVSKDGGLTFDNYATPFHFFEGRLSSCHFLQFGKGYECARDGYVYAYFPCDEDDNQSYWENNDGMLLGRVPKDKILQRDAWEFFSSSNPAEPRWSHDEKDAKLVFRYYKMTGSNHVVYNPGIKRYIMGNYSFVDEELHPRPIHQMRYPEASRSQLTLYEAPEPWGPWRIFHRDDNWGTYGDYQPNFPVKWMSEDGHVMMMISAGSWDDYNLVSQKVALRLKGETSFPSMAKEFLFKVK